MRNGEREQGAQARPWRILGLGLVAACSSSPAADAVSTLDASDSTDAALPSFDASLPPYDASLPPFDASVPPADASVPPDAFDAADASASSADASCDGTLSDPLNCGVCGHVCARGACVNGVCPSVQPALLASQQHSPVSLAVDGTNVYWLNAGTPPPEGAGTYQNGSVVACALGGCNLQPTPLVEGFETIPLYTTWLTLDSTRVYFTEPLGTDAWQIAACATSGCNGTSTTVALAEPNGLASDGTTLYWTAGTTLFGCTGGTCPAGPTSLWSEPDDAAVNVPAQIVARNGVIFWTDELQEVQGCVVGDCATPTVFTSTAVGAPLLAGHALAVDAVNVYWATEVGIFSCPRAGCTKPTTLFQGAAADQLTTDGTNLYWTDELSPSGMRIATCALPSCETPVTLIDRLGIVSAIAVDDTRVYFATSGAGAAEGTVESLVK